MWRCVDDGFAAWKYTSERFVSTARMPLVTSHSPDVRKRGFVVFAGLNSARWLYPSDVGTISRYAGSSACSHSFSGRG